MINFTDMLVFTGMLFLRFGVPLLIVVGIGYLLKRLDRRWEAEAWAEQEKARAAEVPAEQPAVPAPRPAPARKPVPAPAPALPFIPPQIRETPRTQPGMTMAQVQPCYDVKGCSDSKKAQCAAPQHPEQPCWQARFDAEGAIPEDCVGCDIFHRLPMM
jgi:hypothetical protein